MPGGLLGVDVFFVLSGYLITDILFSQWRERRSIDLRDFWLRRARRILPALLLMLTGVLAWMAVFDRSQIPPISGDIVASLLFVGNWWLILHHVSYFASFGPPSPLGNLWSLGVEEQFYLLWPLALVAAARLLRRRGRLLSFILIIAAASALWMAVLYVPGANPTRVYDGTDTRAFSLLIGAALAIVWPSGELPRWRSVTVRKTVDLVGVAALIAVIAMMVSTNEYQTFVYLGGMVCLSLVCAVLIAVVAHPQSMLGSLLGNRLLTWLGKRSYGLYLWHYPVIALTTPTVTTGSPALRDIAQVGASIILADLSYRFVETPIRQRRVPFGKAQRQISRQKRAQDSAKIERGLRWRHWLTPMCLACVGILSIVAGTDVPVQAKAGSVIPVTAVIAPPAHASPATLGMCYSIIAARRGRFPGTVAHARTRHSLVIGSGRDVTAIGDSIMLDAKPWLQQMLPGIYVDGKVSRQMDRLQAVIDRLRRAHELRGRVVIELGTNGPFVESQLISALRSLGTTQRIVLVNTRVPRPWEAIVNERLAQAAKAVPDAVLVNWYQASAGKP
ncbi:MAG: acyltransferase family protein, partial [Firmicutes bacterium]|nr:acyltransferase family protein [Bacillota bacterium]